MKMIPINSSSILAVGYEPTARRMRIKFRQGRAYEFCNVPEDIYQGLLNAASAGRYYDTAIRGRYQC